jgi:hypothetical protein
MKEGTRNRIAVTLLTGSVLLALEYGFLKTGYATAFFGFVWNLLWYDIPLWATSVFVSAATAVTWYAANQRSLPIEEVSLQHSLEPQSPDYLDYTEDVVESLKWDWDWENGKVKALKSYCPNCSMEIYPDPITELREVPKPWGKGQEPVAIGSEVKCPKCGFSKEWDQKPRDFEHYVRKEIERRKKTGEWKNGEVDESLHQGSVMSNDIKWEYFWQDGELKHFDGICPDCDSTLRLGDIPGLGLEERMTAVCDTCDFSVQHHAPTRKIKRHAEREITQQMMRQQARQ